MKTQAFILSIAVVASTAIAAPDAGKPAAAAAPARVASPAEQAMEARWMKAMTPGAQHKRLAEMAGNWKLTTKVWMDPAQPPQLSTGKSEIKSVLGGRYIEERMNGSMMGSPFEGMGMIGYDNVKGKYVSTWADSMGTMVIYATGTADATGKVITSTCTMWDPMTDKDITARLVSTAVNADQRIFEMYQPGPDGKEMRTMEITYDRVK